MEASAVTDKARCLSKHHPHLQADEDCAQDLLTEVGQDEPAADFLLRAMAIESGASLTAQQAEMQPVPFLNAVNSDGSGSDRSTNAGIDIYHKHRHTANKLTRQWRKSVHSAKVAYAVGNHTGRPSTCCVASFSSCNSMNGSSILVAGTSGWPTAVWWWSIQLQSCHSDAQ